jgi:hypothetical protein
MQAVALRLGPLSPVQPILVCDLPAQSKRLPGRYRTLIAPAPAIRIVTDPRFSSASAWCG